VLSERVIEDKLRSKIDVRSKIIVKVWESNIAAVNVPNLYQKLVDQLRHTAQLAPDKEEVCIWAFPCRLEFEEFEKYLGNSMSRGQRRQFECAATKLSTSASEALKLVNIGYQFIAEVQPIGTPLILYEPGKCRTCGKGDISTRCEFCRMVPISTKGMNTI
jgi:hypothetical protein